MKSIRPAYSLKCLLAFSLGSVVFDKFRHRKPLLKLDSVHRHDHHLWLIDDDHYTGRVAHQMSRAGVHL
jgi:hypothetical protein